MSALPTKRLLVYVAVGLVMMVVGGVGLAAAGGGSSDDGGVVIDTGGVADGVADGGLVGGTLEVTTTTQVPRVWVQVAGAVHVPGVYELAAGSRVFEAVAAAGGFADGADQQAVALAARVADGCRVYVPKVGEMVPGGVVGPADSAAGVSGGAGGDGLAGGPVSLNSASAQQLDSLPGIGPALAQQIIAYREAQGPFTSIEQLTEVPGIGPAKLEQLRPLVVL